MVKVRIIERTNVNGDINYIIQQRHFLFKWWWVDAWMNYDVSTNDTFYTLKDAKNNLCYFDGTKIQEKIIK